MVKTPTLVLFCSLSPAKKTLQNLRVTDSWRQYVSLVCLLKEFSDYQLRYTLACRAVRLAFTGTCLEGAGPTNIHSAIFQLCLLKSSVLSHRIKVIKHLASSCHHLFLPFCFSTRALSSCLFTNTIFWFFSRLRRVITFLNTVISFTLFYFVQWRLVDCLVSHVVAFCKGRIVANI